LWPSAGYVGVVLFLITVVEAALRRDKGRGVLAVTAIAFFLFIVNLNLFWTRWLLPLMPLYLTLVALAVQDIACRLAWTSGREAVAVMASTAICVGVLAVPLAELKIRLAENGENPHTTVFKWIVANAPDNSAILLELYGPQLPNNKYKLWAVSGNGALAPIVSSRRYVPPKGKVGMLADLNEIEAKGIEFIVLDGWYYRFKNEHERYVETVSRYEELMGKYPTVFETSGMRILRVK
jgi:hypothetical protein